MTRNVTPLVKDAAIAGLAGYLATRVMEPVSQKLYEMESEQARKQEDERDPARRRRWRPRRWQRLWA